MRLMNQKRAMQVYWVLVVAAVIVILSLASSRPAEASEAHPVGMDLAAAGDFDTREIPSSARTRQYDDKVLFRLLDDDFEAVSVTGSFNDWQPLALEFDPKSGAWSVTVSMEPGRYSYQYRVRDSVEQWEAIDPSNPHAKRDPDHGWVSLITVSGSGQSAGESAGERVEDDEEEDRAILDSIDVQVDFGFSDGEKDDEDTWRTHSRRFLKRELKMQYDKLGENIHYQRVDGLSLAIDPSAISREAFGPAVRGLFSYGFRSEEWTLGGVLVQPLLENRRLMAKVTGHSGTDFQDNTGIGGIENSLACVFFREDYRDYYHREGLTVSLVGYPLTTVRLEAGYESSEYESLETQETWSFADGDFAANPGVDEGTLRSFFANARIGTRNNHILAAYETGRNREGDDFDYSLLKTTYRGRLHLSRSRYADFRLMYASGLTGEVPMQRRFPVGGLGTVRGYYYQSLLTPDPEMVLPSLARGGQRMLVANFEYAVSFDTDIMWNADAWDSDWEGFADSGNFEIDSAFFLFFDTGMAWENRSAEFDLEDLKSSAGIGFQFDDGGPRFDIVKTLDDGGHDTLFQIRLERMF